MRPLHKETSSKNLMITMTKLIQCKKYHKELPALKEAPFPGALGEKFLATISQQAWNDWIELQTMLINEKMLNLASFEDRQYLAKQRQLFFDNADYEKPEGFKE